MAFFLHDSELEGFDWLDFLSCLSLGLLKELNSDLGFGFQVESIEPHDTAQLF